MAEIKCPMCSKPNPAELDVCQFCEARLKPVTDELSRSQPPLHPGEEPTQKDTGELEPILPQWLRDVRQQARETTGEGDEQFQAEEETFQLQGEEPGDDLLAGLQSQEDEKEEIPDWLSGLRGGNAQASPDETTEDGADLSALKGMFGEEPADAGKEDDDDALPGWISDLGAEETGAPAQAEQTPSASSSEIEWSADFGTGTTGALEGLPESATSIDDGSDLPDWMRGADETEAGNAPPEVSPPAEPSQAAPTATSEAPESEMSDWLSSPGDQTDEPIAQETSQPAADGDVSDWLASLDSGSDETASAEPAQPAADDDTPDWLASLEGESAEAPTQEPAQPAGDIDTPDWLASLGEENTDVPVQEPAQPADDSDTPDWLASLGEASAETPVQEPAQPASDSDTPDWLTSLGEEDSAETPAQESAQSADDSDTPDWLASLGEASAETPAQEPAQSTSDIDTPDWLASLGGDSADAPPQEPAQQALEGDTPDWLSSPESEAEPTDAQKPAQTGPFTEGISQPVEGETPDWLSSVGGETGEPEQPEQPAQASAFTTEETTENGASVAPAFIDDEGDPLATDDVEAIFSMDMPDWLSETDSAGQVSGEALGAPENDDLRPADLPSWVQAMRPVESVISETDGEIQGELPMEEEGPLAGLRGVLPAVPGVGPSSKPKQYSVKLQASQEQQSSAAMLEQMLASEIHPEPITTQKVILSQRILRWIIAVLLLVVVGGSVFSGTQINPVPVGAPPETSAAIRYIQESLPADAPVLLIFDYEAALTGELEATAAPFVDHMLLLKHPRLSLVASTPTGAGLAERFMRDTQSSHNYQAGQQFVNLGYLPGGAAGVLAFSENPAALKPNTINGDDAWNTPALQGVTRLSDYAAIILLTNDVESARIWIEQTENARGETRFLVISSAQSGPMILPYVQTGQVDGMVTGLDGSAPIEKVNSGRPGMVRRYWDAYGFGLLTALTMITVGSLWSLIAGWQARRKERGEA